MSADRSPEDDEERAVQTGRRDEFQAEGTACEGTQSHGRAQLARKTDGMCVTKTAKGRGGGVAKSLWALLTEVALLEATGATDGGGTGETCHHF